MSNVVTLSVFSAEKAIARHTGRCMACDKATKWMPGHARRDGGVGRYAQLCGDRDCFRYYQTLYYAARRQARRAQPLTAKAAP